MGSRTGRLGRTARAVADVALPDIGKAFDTSRTSLILIAVGYFPGPAASDEQVLNVARTRSIALWSTLGGAISALGPGLSGLPLEHFWWGSVFLLRAPSGRASGS